MEHAHGAHAAAAAAAAAPALWALFVVLPAAALAAYLLAARAERGAWSSWRTASFTAGIALTLAAALPPIAAWAHEDLRGHMAQHLLLGMYAPLGLALGAPVTLLLRAAPASAGRRIVACLGTRPVRLAIHPVTMLVSNIGGIYLLYLTPLYGLSLTSPLVHVLVHVHFMVAGFLFAWAIVGPDPQPRRPGACCRLVVLIVGAALHANLAKLMYGFGFPRGAGHDGAALEAAAQWMYYGGDLAETLLAIAFFGAWFGARRAAARRSPPRGRSQRCHAPS